MRVVLDTNVVVSGMLAEVSNPGTILRLVLEGDIELCIDQRIFAEYGRVLRRPKFKFTAAHVEAVLTYIAATAVVVKASAEPFQLPDMDDLPFVQVANGGAANYLITGNLRHYPADRCGNVVVVSPSDFLKAYRDLRQP